MSAAFDQKRIHGPVPKYPTVLSIKENAQDMIVIAGPCSIEGPEQIETVAKELARCGVTYMRGGVYRAGTYPPENYGFKPALLNLWSEIAKRHGLRIIVEVLDIEQVNLMADKADAFQVGARHMQDYHLLDILSRQEKPVSLKRNMGATVDEFLGAAEYLVRNGKRNIILIERGSATHMNHVRWDLSISTIPTVKQLTGIPIIVDASHGTGRRDLVEQMTYAGMAAGANGFLLEVHPDPEKSISDSDQAMPLDRFEDILDNARRLYDFNRQAQRY